MSEKKKRLAFDEKKASQTLGQLIEVFQENRLTTGEIIIVCSNLLYTLGASIGSYDEKGPGLEELKQLYYTEPGRPDVAMMLQGMTMATWYEDWVNLQIQDTHKEGDS